MENNEIALHQHNAVAQMGFLKVNSFSEARELAASIKTSGYAPKGMSEIDIVLSMQYGLELGLQPMQAIQNISVINGKPSIWGDLMLALCKSHRDWEWSKETFCAETQTAKCVVKRKGEPEAVSEFSMDQAKKANLAGKTGPWSQYPQRMLQMRARGFALRDAFPDALKGVISTEEARDYDRVDLSKDKAYTIEAKVVTPEPVELIHPDTLAELGGYILSQEIPEDKVQGWFAFGFSKGWLADDTVNLTLLPESYAQRIVKRLREHEEAIQLSEQLNQQGNEDE